MPSSQLATLSFSTLSIDVATSEMRTGAPFCQATITGM